MRIREWFGGNKKQVVAQQITNRQVYESFVPPKILGWKEALKKLETVRGKLEKALGKTSSGFLPAQSLLLAITGEIEVIKSLNDDTFNCPLPWDEEIGFPSIASFIADARKAGEHCAEKDKNLSALLKSFAGWQLLMTQSLLCWCGANRETSLIYDVLIHHLLTKENGAIVVKQIIAIRSENTDFIKNHYHQRGKKNELYYTPSNVIPQSNIVWTAHNRITIGENINLENLGLERAEEVEEEAVKAVFSSILERKEM